MLTEKQISELLAFAQSEYTKHSQNDNFYSRGATAVAGTFYTKISNFVFENKKNGD